MSETTPGETLAAVTGGSSGIGYALAQEFLEHGYDVVIAAENGPVLQEAATRLRAHDRTHRVETVAADLSTRDGVETFYRALQELGRPVDVLCLNAGIGSGGPFAETDLERELTLIGLNVTGVVHLTKLVLRDMQARRSGKLLFTSSIASTAPSPFEAVYGASKVFVRSFGEALRNELKDTGIVVTVLMPGATETGFFEKADMMDTKVGTGSKDNPGMVARKAFEALEADKDKVVTGMKNKLMAAAGELASDPAGAEMHRKLSEPGGGKR